MRSIHAIKVASEIIKAAKRLKIFTFEELENELSSIPESTLKNQCIEWFLSSTEIDQILGIYYFKD